MTVLGRIRGHGITFNGRRWVYADTGDPVDPVYEDRPCARCGRWPTPEGHDACLGELPDILAACCGHGFNDVQLAYLHEEGGRTLVCKERHMTRVRYVNRDHGHRLYGEKGVILARGKGPGPRNCLVRMDTGELVVGPWGNWRAVK